MGPVGEICACVSLASAEAVGIAPIHRLPEAQKSREGCQGPVKKKETMELSQTLVTLQTECGDRMRSLADSTERKLAYGYTHFSYGDFL